MGDEKEGQYRDPRMLERLLHRAGRFTMPDSQRIAWSRLPPARREMAVRRLSALLRWLEPAPDEAPFPSAADAASAAGMAVSSFYAMAKRWGEEKAVESLGLHVKRTEPRKSEMGPLVERARRLLIAHRAAHPEARDAELIKALDERIRPPLSRTSLQRLVREAKRTMPGTRPFGSLIVFDSAGMDMVDEQGRRLRFSAAIDDGTGTILGWALGSDAEVPLAYEQAVDFALSRGAAPRGPASNSRPPSLLLDPDLRLVDLALQPPMIEVRISPEDHAGHRLLARSDAAKALRIETYLGRTIVATFGESLDRIWIGTGTRAPERSYRTGRLTEFPVISPAFMLRIGRVVELANRRRLMVTPKLAAPWEEEALNPLRWTLREFGDAIFRAGRAPLSREAS